MEAARHEVTMLRNEPERPSDYEGSKPLARSKIQSTCFVFAVCVARLRTSL